jgi:hypothetical protein
VYEKVLKAATKRVIPEMRRWSVSEKVTLKLEGDADGAIKLWRCGDYLYDPGATEKSEHLRAKTLLNEKGVVVHFRSII